MSIPSIGQVGALGGAGDIGRLAELYRGQLLSGAPAADGRDGVDGLSGTSGSGAVGGTAAARGADFAAAIGDGLRSVEALDTTASGKAVQAATGDLRDVHDYVMAATQAQVATELTTTIRNKALEAFNDIMRMPL
jgi:flagellar hook-basal body complex protein FliE